MPVQRQLIDWHTHVHLPVHFSDKYNKEHEARTDYPAATPPNHRKAMEQVEKYVIIGMQWPETGANIPNDFIAEQVAASNGRAKGFASMMPQEEGSPAELERSITTLKLNGLKLSPAYQCFHPSDKGAWKLYEIADHYRIPIMFHSGGTFTSNATLENANPILLDPIARAFPDLKIIVAHLGQPWMQETVMLLRKHDNVYSDLSARFHRPWQLYGGLIIALEYKVSHKLLFGTDFPVSTPLQAIERFKALNNMVAGTNLPRIPEEVIDSIIYERPFELLGL